MEVSDGGIIRDLKARAMRCSRNIIDDQNPEKVFLVSKRVSKRFSHGIFNSWRRGMSELV